MGNWFIWHTCLAHPKEKNFYPKSFLHLAKKPIFQTRKFLMHVWESLAHSKSFLYLSKAISFSNEKVCNTGLKETIDFLPEERKKRFLILNRKSFLHLSEKKKFLKFLIINIKKKETKIFFILVWKNNFSYLRKNVKALHFKCVLDTAPLFFMSAKPSRVFNRLMRVLVCPRIYI